MKVTIMRVRTETEMITTKWAATVTARSRNSSAKRGHHSTGQVGVTRRAARWKQQSQP